MQIAHPTVHILVGIFTISLLPFMFHKTALADGLGIKISPATFRIEAKPPADIWTPFTIENQSDQPVNLTIGYKLFNKQASQNGNVVFLQNGQPFHGQDKNIFQKMQIVDDNNISHDTIDLGPQQRERFRLRILLPDNEPAGDYYFSLILLKNNSNQDQNIINYNKEDQKSSSAFQVGISSNVFLAIGDKEMPQGAITTFSTSLFKEEGPVPFTLTVQNNGLHFFTPHGTIVIKNMFNQTIGKVDIPSSIILAGTSRTFTRASTVTYANISPQQLIWSEHFILGMYTAILSFSLSNNGPTYTRSIHFLAIPSTLLIYFILSVLILFYIYLQVKKKMK